MPTKPANLTFVDLNPPIASFQDDVLEGLSGQPKQISPKYFYDQRGSEIYDQICELKEYYPTRTEIQILKDNIKDIGNVLGSDVTLIEFGCGSSLKIRTLLSSVPHLQSYVPIDISRDYLMAMASELAADFPHISMTAVCADYTKEMNLDSHLDGKTGRRVVFFPGSTIGNLLPTERDEFLRSAAKVAGPDGGLIIGVDLKKDPDILHQAYNDENGRTAEFNKNLLVRINQELKGQFPLDQFDHSAFYNKEDGRVEMHLVSGADMVVRINGTQISFQQGESIHTECSYKYTVDEFQAIATKAGFKPVQVWTDSQNLFSVHFLSVQSS